MSLKNQSNVEASLARLKQLNTSYEGELNRLECLFQENTGVEIEPLSAIVQANAEQACLNDIERHELRCAKELLHDFHAVSEIATAAGKELIELGQDYIQLMEQPVKVVEVRSLIAAQNADFYTHLYRTMVSEKFSDLLQMLADAGQMAGQKYQLSLQIDPSTPNIGLVAQRRKLSQDIATHIERLACRRLFTTQLLTGHAAELYDEVKVADRKRHATAVKMAIAEQYFTPDI